MYTVYILPFRYRAFENWIQFAHTDRAQCDNSIADCRRKQLFLLPALIGTSFWLAAFDAFGTFDSFENLIGIPSLFTDTQSNGTTFGTT